MAQSVSEKEVRKAVGEVRHPAIDCSLMELGIVKEIAVDGNRVHVTMAFPFPGIPIADFLVASVRRPIETLGAEVTVETRVMTPEERAAFLDLEKKHWRGM